MVCGNLIDNKSECVKGTKRPFKSAIWRSFLQLSLFQVFFNLCFGFCFCLQESDTEESDDSGDTTSIAEEQWRGCDQVGDVVESVKKQPDAIVQWRRQGSEEERPVASTAHIDAQSCLFHRRR